jgi:hypothetical protein
MFQTNLFPLTTLANGTLVCPWGMGNLKLGAGKEQIMSPIEMLLAMGITPKEILFALIQNAMEQGAITEAHILIYVTAALINGDEIKLHDLLEKNLRVVKP